MLNAYHSDSATNRKINQLFCDTKPQYNTGLTKYLPQQALTFFTLVS
jgi:hypothetical protein